MIINTLQLLSIINGSGYQRLKMADSESQPLDSRNIVMAISNLCRWSYPVDLSMQDIPKVTSEIMTRQDLVRINHLIHWSRGIPVVKTSQNWAVEFLKYMQISPYMLKRLYQNPILRERWRFAKCSSCFLPAHTIEENECNGTATSVFKAYTSQICTVFHTHTQVWELRGICTVFFTHTYNYVRDLRGVCVWMVSSMVYRTYDIKLGIFELCHESWNT